MKHNAWLDFDKYIIDNVKFPDMIYFRILAKEVSNYIKNAPVPITTWWMQEEQGILFSIGSAIRWLVPIDVNVSYKDYITLVEKTAKKYYPQYNTIREIEIPLNEDEILLLLQKDRSVTFDHALTLKKKIQIKEFGIIEKIFMREDAFIININGERTQRISGIPLKKSLPLSEFLEQIRKLSSLKLENGDIKIKIFIFEHSTEKNRLEEHSILIDYFGMQMVNFFKINFSILKDKEFIKVDDLHYLWGNFRIKFDTPDIERECLTIYRNKLKSKDVSN